MLGFMVERASVFVGSGGGGPGGEGVSRRVSRLESVARRVGAATTEAFVHPKPRRVLGFYRRGNPGSRRTCCVRDASSVVKGGRAWSAASASA